VNERQQIVPIQKTVETVSALFEREHNGDVAMVNSFVTNGTNIIFS